MSRKLTAKQAGIIIFILIAFLFISPLNDCQGTSHEDIVDTEVYHYLDTEAYVPVIAVYNKEPDLKVALDEDNPESTSAQTVVSKLKKINRECEAQIFSLLKEEMAKNNLLDYNSLWIINAFSARVNKEGLQRLSEIPQIKMIRLDHRRQYLSGLAEPSVTKEIFPEDFPGEGEDLFNLKAINVPPLWKEGYFGKGIVVAVMDTGVDLNHPALEQSYRGHIPGHSHKDSWFDATKNDDSSTEGPRDTHGHGTHIAGIILGGTSDKPLGVAPEAHWIAVNIFSDGYAWDSHITQAFQWLLAPGGNPDHAPDIVNCSWASRPEFAEDYLHWEILYNLEKAGILVVFAAGNNGDEGPGSPASYPHSLSVGALKQVDNHFETTNFSSKGPVRWQDISYIKPELVAPGVNIISTWPGNTFAIQDGTSTAAAHLSGAAALLLEAKPDLTPAEVKYLFKSTASWDSLWDIHGPRPNNVYGYGLLDAYAAVKKDPLPRPAEILFFDGAENGVINWKTSPGNPWKITREMVGSGRFSFADSPWENYSSDTASWLALAKPVSLNGYHSPVLSLQHFYDFQKSGNLEDYALVEISVDGINWSVLYRFSGTNEKLQQFSIPITLPQEAESLYFRFRIQSNNNGSGKGWYIDDITLTASPLPLSALQRLRLTPEKTRLGLGEETSVKAGAMFSTHLIREIEPELLTWYSSNPSVARIENGIITALAPGESIIRGTFYDQSAEFKVSVVEVKPAVAQPEPGTYINTLTVSLEAGTPRAKITYTLDGTEPDEKSTVYENSIVISETTILKTRTYLDNIPGPVSEFPYTIVKGARVNGTIRLQKKPIVNGEKITAFFISQDTEERYFVSTFAANGSFAIDLPLGRYFLVVKRDHYLTRTLQVDLQEKEHLDLGLISLLAGDLNNDNKIDLTDLTLLSLAYQTKPGDYNWNPFADLNGDGLINMFDLTVLTQNYGTAGDNVRH